jgi:hypothetical protein
LTLTKQLRWDIQTLGQRLAAAAAEEELTKRGSSKAKSRVANEAELKAVVLHIKKLLAQIEDAVPLMNLAIATSGASLSTNLPPTISPSRLLQASTFLTAGDTQYGISDSSAVQVGPTFVVSLYMLFTGHVRPQSEEDIRQSTWKEVIHKCRLKLVRVPIAKLFDLTNEASEPCFAGRADDANHMGGENRADEFAYQIRIVEDLDDDRVHTFEDGEEKPESFDDVALAGIREAIPIHEISKIFYADTGKILNIGDEGEVNAPILLLKRDLNAILPRSMMERLDQNDEPDRSSLSPEEQIQAQIDAQFARESRASTAAPDEESHEQWRIPPSLDPEWLAFEVFRETVDDDNGEDNTDTPEEDINASSRDASLDPKLTTALSKLDLDHSTISRSPRSNIVAKSDKSSPRKTALPAIQTSLSLLETLLRLLSLQQFRQTSHLAIEDEYLNFFLSESATTGAAKGDEMERRRMRNEAKARVGFDPYDESPVKRRGEDYQYRGGESQAGWEDDQRYDQDYGGYGQSPRHYQDEGRYETPQSTEGYPRQRLPLQNRPRYSDSPLRLKNTASSSRANTPKSLLGREPRVGGEALPSSAEGRTLPLLKVYPRKGTPLRPGTGLTDEGIATSPSGLNSVRQSIEKAE